ncbi:hypothetical protein BDV19DRAFT_390923 [Aspergillus venezuelensis]
MDTPIRYSDDEFNLSITISKPKWPGGMRPDMDPYLAPMARYLGATVQAYGFSIFSLARFHARRTELLKKWRDDCLGLSLDPLNRFANLKTSELNAAATNPVFLATANADNPPLPRDCNTPNPTTYFHIRMLWHVKQLIICFRREFPNSTFDNAGNATMLAPRDIVAACAVFGALWTMYRNDVKWQKFIDEGHVPHSTPPVGEDPVADTMRHLATLANEAPTAASTQPYVQIALDQDILLGDPNLDDPVHDPSHRVIFAYF